MKHRVLMALVCALLTSPAWADRPPMREGLWEITTRMEMKGAPNFMGGRDFTVKQCITKKDLERKDVGIPRNQQNCKVTDVTRSGNKASWKMECSGPNKMSGRGDMRYDADTYEGTIAMHSEGGGRPVDMVQHVKGRRIGECK